MLQELDVVIAKEATVCDQSPFRGIQKLQRDFRELSLWARDTSSSSELEHSKWTSGGMERSASDLARMDLEQLLGDIKIT